VDVLGQGQGNYPCHVASPAPDSGFSPPLCKTSLPGYASRACFNMLLLSFISLTAANHTSTSKFDIGNGDSINTVSETSTRQSSVRCVTVSTAPPLQSLSSAWYWSILDVSIYSRWRRLNILSQGCSLSWHDLPSANAAS
jgi:hypothetical protein